MAAKRRLLRHVHDDELKRRRDLFLEDAAQAHDLGLEVAVREAQHGKDAEAVARASLHACLHSLLVTLDRGTQLADHFLVFVVDEDGNVLSHALHEDFTDHLFDTGRYS